MRYLLVILLSLLLLVPAYAEDYLIGRGDGLEVSVWGVPDMSRSVTVRPDGKITLPAIGDIVASEVTPEKLAEQLTKKIKEYVKKPIVTVSVGAIRNSRIYFTGGGVSSVYELIRKTTLLKLMSELGGFPGSDLRRASLTRDGQVIATDFYALYYDGDMSKDVELQAEDIIYVPTSKLNLVYVLGAVGGPASLQHYEGMRILDAILAAGGFTEFAKENKVTVIDKDKNKRKIDLKLVTSGKDVSENVELNPGDYVIVEESFF